MNLKRIEYILWHLVLCHQNLIDTFHAGQALRDAGNGVPRQGSPAPDRADGSGAGSSDGAVTELITATNG